MEKRCIQPHEAFETHPDNGDDQETMKASLKSLSRSGKRWKGEPPAETRLQFVTPTRLFGWACQVQILRYANNLTINFRTYNYRPNDSPIFQYAWDGDLVKLKHLMSNRQGSIFDVKPDGYTLLHVSNIVHHLYKPPLDPERG